uniref:GDNF family receptor alpha 3 n=1 Tax=Naja naja TaxID=35670 RepID=A0A8C6Y1Z1_NAJNA
MLLIDPNNCVTAETLCLAEPSCSATYQILQNCSQHLSKNSYIFLHHEAKNRCTEAQIKMRNSHFEHCKCHQHAQKKEGRCLQIYRAVHSTLTQGPNACLFAANVCQLDHKCMRQRSQYAQACSTGYPCDQRICHRSLRHFFEKVGPDFTKRLLFCPCQDESCGERRWKTIVPDCSFLSSSKPNCLFLRDACFNDNVCRSRLTGFQEKCKSLQAFTDGCSPLNYAACLQAYMKMIGTSLTPNYVSNSSTEITLWCSCANSGNQKEDCDQIFNLFSRNKCLSKSILNMNIRDRIQQVLTSSGEPVAEILSSSENQQIPPLTGPDPIYSLPPESHLISWVFFCCPAQENGAGKQVSGVGKKWDFVVTFPQEWRGNGDFTVSFCHAHQATPTEPVVKKFESHHCVYPTSLSMVVRFITDFHKDWRNSWRTDLPGTVRILK